MSEPRHSGHWCIHWAASSALRQPIRGVPSRVWVYLGFEFLEVGSWLAQCSRNAYAVWLFLLWDRASPHPQEEFSEFSCFLVAWQEGSHVGVEVLELCMVHSGNFFRHAPTMLALMPFLTMGRICQTNFFPLDLLISFKASMIGAG